MKIAPLEKQGNFNFRDFWVP